MNQPPPLNDDIFAGFLKCRHKAYLKLRGDSGEKSEYERFQARLSAGYRAAAAGKLRRSPGTTSSGC
jgi:hypothetical protein